MLALWTKSHFCVKQQLANSLHMQLCNWRPEVLGQKNQLQMQKNYELFPGWPNFKSQYSCNWLFNFPVLRDDVFCVMQNNMVSKNDVFHLICLSLWRMVVCSQIAPDASALFPLPKYLFVSVLTQISMVFSSCSLHFLNSFFQRLSWFAKVFLSLKDLCKSLCCGYFSAARSWRGVSWHLT